MKNGFAPQPAVNGFAEQRLRAFVDDVVAPAERQRQAADRAALIEWAGSTWPAVAAKAALSGAMLPGDVAQGKFSMDDPRAIERLTDLTGLITLGAGALPAQKNSLRAGIKAYHGSPHDFDEFSLSKIGTGEGAQAFGHGLYFTETEDIARGYRDALTGNHYGDQRVLKLDGREVKDPTDIQRRLAFTYGNNPDGLIDQLQKKRTKAVERANAASKEDELGMGFSEHDLFMLDVADIDKQIAEAESLRGANLKVAAPGNMYEVEINANPDDFLDWDKPFREQPEIAKKMGVDPYARIKRADRIIEELQADMKAAGRTEMDEIDLRNYRLAEELEREHTYETAGTYAPRGDAMRQELLAKGIPGIKYLDGNSRGAGEGSRNYVVFDDKLINILRKYGIAVPAGMAGYEMTQDQFRQYVAEQQAQQYERENNATRLGIL